MNFATIAFVEQIKETDTHLSFSVLARFNTLVEICIPKNTATVFEDNKTLRFPASQLRQLELSHHVLFVRSQ